MKLIVTCEHGGNTIPNSFLKYFENHKSVLNSHRAHDLGSLDLFKTLESLANFSLFSETSRLLIELNRSLHHKSLFSEFSKNMSKIEKQDLIESYYLVYRNQVENTIRNWIENGEVVLHISIHSFTPVLNKLERHCDIGLLYDSKRHTEKAFCVNFKKEIIGIKPELKVRYNYPYLGTADGFTTHLRRQFTSNYMGIEIEVNQKYAKNNLMITDIKESLFLALKETIA